jgi:hypothetical protein
LQTEKVWESQGQYFTKIPILIGDYINKKGIGVRNKDIPRTEYRWKDTDYTVHPSKNHPPIPPVHGGADAISWILAHNRKYSIGKVVDIDRTTAANGIHTLKGTVQFAEPKLAKQAYELGVIPLYNSSSIYETARDEKTGLTTDYVPIDNCAVDTPAGDLELFKTVAFCEGGTECIHDLKQSGINSECGYCKLEALKSLKFHYPIADEIHDSHNSTNLQQSSSMETDTSNAGTEPKPDTTKKADDKSAKGKEGKGAEQAKTEKTINDSGWVSSKEDEAEGGTEEGEESESEEKKSKGKEKEKPVDYKKMYEEEKAKNDSTNKTVTELLAESRLNKLKEKFQVLPMEVWEGDEKAKVKDIEFFNSLYDKKIDEALLNKILEKWVSKIPVKALVEVRGKMKQSGMSMMDMAVTHDYIARTESSDSEEQFTEADAVLGALED